MFCGSKVNRSDERVDLTVALFNFTDDPLLTQGTAVSFSGTTSKEAAVCNRSSLMLPAFGAPIVEAPLGTLVGVGVMESGAGAVDDGEEGRT